MCRESNSSLRTMAILKEVIPLKSYGLKTGFQTSVPKWSFDQVTNWVIFLSNVEVTMTFTVASWWFHGDYTLINGEGILTRREEINYFN